MLQLIKRRKNNEIFVIWKRVWRAKTKGSATRLLDLFIHSGD